MPTKKNLNATEERQGLVDATESVVRIPDSSRQTPKSGLSSAVAGAVGMGLAVQSSLANKLWASTTNDTPTESNIDSEDVNHLAKESGEPVEAVGLDVADQMIDGSIAPVGADVEVVAPTDDADFMASAVPVAAGRTSSVTNATATSEAVNKVLNLEEESDSAALSSPEVHVPQPDIGPTFDEEPASALDPTSGDEDIVDGGVDGMIDSLFGDDGVLTDLLGEDGLVDALVGEGGLLDLDILDGLIGDDGLLDGVVDIILSDEGFVSEFLGGVDSLLDPIIDDVLDPIVDDIVAPIIDDVLDPIVDDIVAPIIDDVLDPIVDDIVAPIVDDVLDPIVDDIVAPIIDDVLDPIVDDIVAPIVDDVLDPVVDVLDPVVDVLDPVVDVLDPVVDVLDPVVDVLDPVVDVLDPVVDVLDPIVDVLDPVVGVLDPIVGDALDPILGGLLGDLPILGGLLGGDDSDDELTLVASEDDGYLESLLGIDDTGEAENVSDLTDGLSGDTLGDVLTGLLGEDDAFGVDVEPTETGGFGDLFAGLEGEGSLTGSLMDHGLLNETVDVLADGEVDSLLSELLGPNSSDVLAGGDAIDALLGGAEEEIALGGELTDGLVDGADDLFNGISDVTDTTSNLLDGLFSSQDD